MIYHFPLAFLVSCLIQTVDLTPEKKDLEHYRLPPEIAQKAPCFQDHIYRLLPYESGRYQVKPNFVFMDQEKKNEGMFNVLVANMSILHLSYYEGNRLEWYGSVYFETESGLTLFSKKGYELDVQCIDKEYVVQLLREEHALFKVSLPTREERALWIEDGQRKLLIHLFLLRTSMPRE
ncbi:MAG: hypothetical protein CSA81_01520 [Acidobacteria bacterium]|nr:MAG: hypothetical protein CSA81_01520 [Acidobacteriota bacterium]